MKTDRPADDAPAPATADWLQGLAGRPGAGPAHAEGARIRAALAPQAQDEPTASWHDIEARAAAADAAAGAPARPADPVPPVPVARPDAANDARPRRWLGWAAAAFLCLGLVSFLAPQGTPPDAALRGVDVGVGSPAAPRPRWLVDHPREAAEALAAELRAMQADVSLVVEGETVVLDIRAAPGAVNAVNARLTSLETGLDAAGQLQLQVVPLR